jgi:3-hydroxyacyl-CoA dehydrogenase/enoyl-CoA hydratase/3-hydroxybutyryl-CoA epimerase
VDASARALIGVAGAATPIRDLEDRLVYAMLNEAARALDEGVVRTARDGDIAAIFGIGFPPFRGGPLRTLDRMGAARVVETLRRLEETHGPRFAPAPVLVRHAERGTRFYPTP